MAQTAEQLIDFMGKPRTFVRIYKLPAKLTSGYCFGGGNLIQFLNVDWFETVIEEGREALVNFIRTKQYFDPRAKFLVIGDHSDFTFIIEPPEKTD